MLGKNLTSKWKNKKKKELQAQNERQRKRKQRYFFRNLAEVKTKYQRAVHRMSLKTFQAAQRIILKFNRELNKKPREISEEV